MNILLSLYYEYYNVLCIILFPSKTLHIYIYISEIFVNVQSKRVIFICFYYVFWPAESESEIRLCLLAPENLDKQEKTDVVKITHNNDVKHGKSESLDEKEHEREDWDKNNLTNPIIRENLQNRSTKKCETIQYRWRIVGIFVVLNPNIRFTFHENQ